MNLHHLSVADYYSFWYNSHRRIWYEQIQIEPYK
jgi:hypothetical protein